MRTKFEQPRVPSDQEQLFIQYVSGFHDTYGLSERTLCIFLNTTPRTLRKWKERYNNFKYIGVTPIGKLHVINGMYKLIRPESRHCRTFQLKAELDLVCAAIQKHNTRKILGELQVNGQTSSLDDMTYDELVNYQSWVESELENE